MQGIKGFSKELATSYGSGVKLEPGKPIKKRNAKYTGMAGISLNMLQTA